MLLKRFLSRIIIKANIDTKPPRPFNLSMYSPSPSPNIFSENNCMPKKNIDYKSYDKWHLSNYTSWDSLTDETFSTRLLPPITTEKAKSLPPIDEVVSILMRNQRPMKSCHRTSLLFMGFAQWFTDAFLRIDIRDLRKNTSTHEIDLCQIYGLNRQTTDLLRSNKLGCLKTQIIDGKEFAPFLFNNDLSIKEEYKNLQYLNSLKHTYRDQWKNEERKKLFFVFGLDRGNTTITHTAINTLFIRLHNKVARLLHSKYTNWDDERLFQTTRNILIATLIKVTIEDYVNHLKPFSWMKFKLDTTFAEKSNWYRDNWISTEFNLAYRWHSLIPDNFEFKGKTLDTANSFRFNNNIVLKNDLTSIFETISYQKAGKITLGNTPDFLREVEMMGLYISRASQLDTFDVYKNQFSTTWDKAFRKNTINSFSDVTKDVEMQYKLKQLYKTPDKMDYTIGLIAEDQSNMFMYEDAPILGRTMLNLVASDAFSHALTNPILSNNVYDKKTFSNEGWELIHQFTTLKDIIDFVEEKDAKVSFNYNDFPNKL